MDQGGELYNNPAIKNLFQKYSYEILLTSPNASYQNRPIERTHQIISQGIKNLLISAGLYVKFLLYDFMHVLHIYNVLPGQGQDAFPLFLWARKIISEIYRFLAVVSGYDLLVFVIKKLKMMYIKVFFLVMSHIQID